jgi:hypothetical protein
MKIALIALSLTLTGCAYTTQKFPDPPPELTKNCEYLIPVIPGEQDKTPITELLKTVVKNYTLYYQCSNRVDGWIKWHAEQKKIFGELK